MGAGAALIALGFFSLIFLGALWATRRSTRRPPPPQDLRRADEAEAGAPFDQAAVTEEVEGTFWRGPRH